MLCCVQKEKRNPWIVAVGEGERWSWPSRILPKYGGRGADSKQTQLPLRSPCECCSNLISYGEIPADRSRPAGIRHLLPPPPNPWAIIAPFPPCTGFPCSSSRGEQGCLESHFLPFHERWPYCEMDASTHFLISLIFFYFILDSALSHLDLAVGSWFSFWLLDSY